MPGTTEPIRVVVAGAGGRMGRETVRAVAVEKDMIVAAESHRGDDLATVLRDARADVLVDFTVPESVMANLRVALAAKVVPIVGTTGLSTDDLAEIRSLCAENGVGALVAPNFAIGAVLLMQFAQAAAKYMPDVEIIEMHHERKLDAPSGTAVKTAALIAAVRDASLAKGDLPGAFETVSGARGGRAEGSIPVHSIRLPGFVASQEVIFGGRGSAFRCATTPSTAPRLCRASFWQFAGRPRFPVWFTGWKTFFRREPQATKHLWREIFSENVSRERYCSDMSFRLRSFWSPACSFPFCSGRILETLRRSTKTPCALRTGSTPSAARHTMPRTLCAVMFFTETTTSVSSFRNPRTPSATTPGTSSIFWKSTQTRF
jgi:4-hydroxy-tetrahydrodipicolinate reductase